MNTSPCCINSVQAEKYEYKRALWHSKKHSTVKVQLLFISGQCYQTVGLVVNNRNGHKHLVTLRECNKCLRYHFPNYGIITSSTSSTSTN